MSGMCPDSQSAQLPDSKVYLSLSLSLGWSPATAVLQLPFQSLVKNESRQRVQFNSGSVGCSTQAGLSNSTVTEVTLSLYACMYFLSLSLSLASLAVNQPSHTDTRLVKTEMCVHVYEYVYIYIYAHRCVCVCNPWSHRDAFAFIFVLSQGDAGDFHGRHPTKTPWISCDMSQGRLTHVPAFSLY